MGTSDHTIVVQDLVSLHGRRTTCTMKLRQHGGQRTRLGASTVSGQSGRWAHGPASELAPRPTARSNRRRTVTTILQRGYIRDLAVHHQAPENNALHEHAAEDATALRQRRGGTRQAPAVEVAVCFTHRVATLKQSSASINMSNT